MLKYKITIILILFSLCLVGCHQKNVINESPDIKQLKDTIRQYYLFEMNSQWNETYKYRTPIFKKSFNKNEYIKWMQEENSGWKLINIKVESIQINKDRANVEIKFKDRHKEKDLIIKETTKWKKIDNRWYTISPGSRNHIDLNNEVIIE